jgi:hypothetical protein
MDSAAMLRVTSRLTSQENTRLQLSKIKPDIVMIAEANKPELLVNAFDLDYAWPFIAP